MCLLWSCGVCLSVMRVRAGTHLAVIPPQPGERETSFVLQVREYRYRCELAKALH